MKKITFLLFTFLSLSLVSQIELTSSLTESYNGNTWENGYKTEYSYSVNGNVTEVNDLFWDSSIWKTDNKTFYTYNADNKVTVELNQNFDSDTSLISDEYRANFTYSSNGDLIEILEQDFNGSTWDNFYKTDFTYTNNRVSGGLSYEWNGANWVFDEVSSKIDINYNTNGTISSFTFEEWDGANWAAGIRLILTYNSEDKLSLTDSQYWDGTAWTSLYKVANTYDTNGNLVAEKESYLVNGIFVDVTEETATFNTSELMSSFIHPFKDKTGIDFLTEPNGIVNKILTRSSGDSNRTTYNYSEATASNKDFNSIPFIVYPNPASSFLKVDDSSFSLENMQIFNLVGQKLLSTTKNQLNIERLINGVYLLKVQNINGDIVTKRFVKK